MATLYESLGGFDALLAACRRWHQLCLADPVAAHPFEHALHPQHDERLAAYLAEATGGPKLYTAGYGDESSMQRMHAGNGEHGELLRAMPRAVRAGPRGRRPPRRAGGEACGALPSRHGRASGVRPEQGSGVPEGLALPEWT